MCITLEHVSRAFEGRKVLQDVSLSLPRQGRICLFGPSGCGKTTLLRLICGLDRPDGGRVTIPAGTRFSCHFQEDRLLPWYTAEENLALALGGVKPARAWLARVGLAEAADKLVAGAVQGLLALHACHARNVGGDEEHVTRLLLHAVGCVGRCAGFQGAAQLPNLLL